MWSKNHTRAVRSDQTLNQAVSCFRQCQQQYFKKNCNREMPSQNNIKTTLCILKYYYLLNNLFHHESEMNAAHSHQQFHLAHPHSFCFYLGKAVKSATDLAGFGPDTNEHGRCHAHMEQDGSLYTAGTRAEGPGQLKAPELLCQQRKSLCESQGRQEHLDIHVVDKTAWEFSAWLSSQGRWENKKELKCKASR